MSDLALDRMIAGELDAATERTSRGHIEGCERCAARLAGIEQAKAAFLENPPVLVLPATHRKSNVFRLVPRLAAPLALAAVTSLYFATTHDEPSDEPGTRIKGTSKINYYKKHGDTVTKGMPGDEAAPGDTLQFTVSTNRSGYLAILSVDGARKAGIYYPSGARAAPVSPGTDISLPTSVVLDDVLGDETAYGLFCSNPIELEPVRAAFEASPENPPIPSSCEVDKLPFVKRRPR